MATPCRDDEGNILVTGHEAVDDLIQDVRVELAYYVEVCAQYSMETDDREVLDRIEKVRLLLSGTIRSLEEMRRG